MLKEILGFEWRYHTRQASFPAAVLLFLLLGFVLTVMRFGPDNVAVNSPYLVMEASALISLFALFAAASFAGNAVLRDDEYRMAEIVHCTPVGRFAHLFGRFSGAFLATLTAVSVSVAGMLIGRLMPWVEPERVAPLDPRVYLAAFGVITIPNVLLATALLFAVAVLTRSAVATYSAAVALYILYLVCAALTNSPLMAASRPGAGGGTAFAILDPFGMTSFFEVTRLWTSAAKNNRFIPLTGTLLLNRLLWVGAAGAIWAVVYRRFSFRTRVVQASRPASAGPPPEAGLEARTTPSNPFLAATKMELRGLLSKSTLLLLLLWFGLAFSEIYTEIMQGEYGSASYPATSLILTALELPLTIIATILTIYYGAEMFWREQRYRMAPILDSTPVRGSVMIAAKFAALAALIVSVIFVGILAGVAVQISQAHWDLQPLLYLSLLYFVGLPLLLYAAASLLIHSLSPGKYAGMIFVLLFIGFSRMAGRIGLEHPLWRFAAGPREPYTELAGFGHQPAAFHLFMLHWAVLALLFTALAALLWRRIGGPLGERIRLLARPSRLARVLVVLAVVTGGWIFYDTNIAEEYRTSGEVGDWKADYEKQWKAIETLPRPRIRAVDGEVDLYPKEQRYRVAGRYELVNETAAPIDRVFVAVRREARVDAISMRDARLGGKDTRFGMYRFDLHKPLAPGAGTELRFDLSFQGDDDTVIDNGSFLPSWQSFPSLGYRRSYELNDPRERRKRGLQASLATLEEDGTHASVEASDEEWIRFRATVSTDGDQIAVAPGRLEKSWERDGRRWFRYAADAPILNRFAFLSARYVVATRQHGPVTIEVLHHPAHAENVPRMLDATAAALDVMQRYAPYPHRQLRIVEVSANRPFGGYAFPATILLRENGAFLTDARDPNRPDLVARRTAHEVAHQWFGYHVVAANVEGASLITESLTKYAELLVLERMHGREHARQILELELDRYLSGRAGEQRTESPLYKARNQPYIYYSKGALVLYAIRDLIGEEATDGAIRNLMNERRPTSLDLVRHLRTAAGVTHGPLVEQWLKEIVLYDFRLDAASFRRRTDGRFDVTLRVSAAKTRADGAGNESPLPLHEAIEIAIEGEKGVLESRKVELRGGMNEITLVVDSLPIAATVDPWITRIDRTPRDNARRF